MRVNVLSKSRKQREQECNVDEVTNNDQHERLKSLS